MRQLGESKLSGARVQFWAEMVLEAAGIKFLAGCQVSQRLSFIGVVGRSWAVAAATALL